MKTTRSQQKLHDSKRRKCEQDAEHVELDIVCPIHLEVMETEVTFPCGHYICAGCWKNQDMCPKCRAHIPMNWTPSCNMGLRVKLGRVFRTAKCGEGPFKLKALRQHRKTCMSCMNVQMNEKNEEIRAYAHHIENIERDAETSMETIRLLREHVFNLSRIPPWLREFNHESHHTNHSNSHYIAPTPPRSPSSSEDGSTRV